MPTIPNAGREIQLYLHTVASAVACTSQKKAVTLELGDTREPSPAAQKAKVAALLDNAMASLDAVIRSKKIPPTDIPVATLGKRIVERGEKYDAVNRTYTPGPGFEVFLTSLVTDEVAAAQMQAAHVEAEGEARLLPVRGPKATSESLKSRT